MDWNESTRRSFLKQFGAAALAAASADGLALPAAAAQAPAAPQPVLTAADQKQAATREQRMQWWHEARFGMFIHWGLYSVIGQHEWARETEGIPLLQYELLAKNFHPKPNAARDWVRLAKRAGQKYMVMTTRHHEGFCHWDSKLTDYNAAKQGPGRDLVREFVEAARAEGLRVGFYYSLMDWHHPDGATCKTDEAARRRFVDYTHGLIRELLTNYGKIDILWYDVAWPLNAEQWESERMNEMVFELQPDILVNNRNLLLGDFATPEQRIQADATRAWEACMTLNDSWGFNRGDDAWKTPKTIAQNLAICGHGGGNYLLNIGPEQDGSIPPETVTVLEAVGKWLDTNGKAIYGAERMQASSGNVNANYTRKGNTLYIHQHFWPGHTPAADWLTFYQPETVISIGGLKPKVLSARLLKTGQSIKFTQDEFNMRLTGLPVQAPDQPATVIEVECDGEPIINQGAMRSVYPRYKVGISV
jgi:alpha-L-fucosidase